MVKDMKAKMTVSENLIQKKQMEVDAIKAKLEKKIAEDDKHQIKDKTAWEKHFGKQPRPAEEKVTALSLNFSSTSLS